MDAAAESALWFYGSGAERKGPYAEAQLAALVETGAVTAQTPVWCDGMAGWQSLADTPLVQKLHAHLLAAGQAPVNAAAAPQPLQPPGRAPRLGWLAATRQCFWMYATFRGRASRSEFWYWQLSWLVAATICVAIDTALGSSVIMTAVPVGTTTLTIPHYVGVLYPLLNTAVFMPSISVAVRRLHDTGLSGWLWWLQLIPVVGWLALVVLWCRPGEPTPNRYG